MMKNEKKLAARGCLCVESNSPECSVPYIVTDPKGELLHYEEKIKENGYKIIVSEFKR